MNRPIIKSNRTNGNAAFLSAETQNAIYDACELLERRGVEFFYVIKNGEYSNGDFIYIYNSEKKTLSWQPSAQSEKAFLDEVKSALFSMLAEVDDEKKNLKRHVITITETFAKSVAVYAESPEQARAWAQRKYEDGEIKLNSEDIQEHELYENTANYENEDLKGLVDFFPTYTAPACLYEVHEIEDKFTGTPATVNTCEEYAEAIKLYNEIDEEGKPARLLKVDYEGDPIDEIKSNY